MEILTVSQVNVLARKVLEEYSFWVKGEVSNSSSDKYTFKYFSLKDDNACIACIMLSAKVTQLDFKIEDGITIKAYGTLSVFERDGKFQLKVEKVEKDGDEGDLQKRIEEIKNKLQHDGLLDAARKRKLPEIPSRIAVITSKDGAAWKDFLKILTERYPNMEILLYDVLVQGEKSAQSVIQALTYINTHHIVDLVVITRGGGSLEDLMSFNDEALARAIAASQAPVVSAIGHEKDVSISDLVADLRASTPSNAAELITPHKDSLYQLLDELLFKMHRWAKHAIQLEELNLMHTIERSGISDGNKFVSQYKNELDAIKDKVFGTKNKYENYQYLLEDLRCKIELQVKQTLGSYEADIKEEYQQIRHSSQSIFLNNNQLLEKLFLRIDLNNPLQILKKGYSIVSDISGNIVSDIATLKAGSEVETKISNGSFRATILSTKSND